MLDLDGDHTISFEEFVEAQTYFSTGEKPHPPVSEEVRCRLA